MTPEEVSWYIDRYRRQMKDEDAAMKKASRSRKPGGRRKARKR
jgi:Zn-dependent oligopeptidase